MTTWQSEKCTSFDSQFAPGGHTLKLGSMGRMRPRCIQKSVLFLEGNLSQGARVKAQIHGYSTTYLISQKYTVSERQFDSGGHALKIGSLGTALCI